MSAEITTPINVIDKMNASFYIRSTSKHKVSTKSISQPMKRSQSEQQIIELLTEHQGKLFAYIYSQTSNPEATTEILQETSLVIWNKREQFEIGTSFNAWSQSIAYFQIKAYRQKKYRDRLVFDDQIMERMKDTADKLEEKHDIRKEKLNKCIGKLQEKYQNLVNKRYKDGLSVNEIAEQSGLPANTLTQAFFRIRQKLSECVKKVDVK